MNAYKVLVDGLPIGCFVLDTKGAFTVVNRAFAALLGSDDPGYFTGLPASQLPADMRSILCIEEDRDVFSAGAALSRETEVDAPDGQKRWFECFKNAIREENGTIVGLIGMLREITDHKRTAQKLLESEARYRAVFENAPIGIFHSTTDGKLVDANPAFARIIGYDSPEELIESVNRVGISSLYGNASRRRAVASEAVEDRGWRLYQGAFRYKDRRQGIGRMMLRGYIPVGGSTPMLEGFVEDVTAQTQASEALDRERSLLKSLMDNVPERIYFKDLEGRFTLVNNAQAMALGLGDPNYAVGMRNEDFFSPEYAARLEREETEIVQRRRTILGTEELEVTYDGRETWILATRMALRNPEGTVVGTFGVTHDISAQKRLEYQLIRAHRLESLAQLAAGIAHQFNNINTAVSGYLSLMKSMPSLPEGARAYIEKATLAIQRATGITRRLDVLYSASAAEQELLRLEDVVRLQIHHFHDLCARYDVEVSVDLAATGSIIAERGTIEFVLSSVVTNSIHAVIERPDRKITVRTRTMDKFSGLEVVDTGEGITAENLARMFTPFFTTKGEWAAPRSPQVQVRGVGLSLAVCRSIVLAHGGSVDLESKERVGTTVRLWFPVADENPISKKPA